MQVDARFLTQFGNLLQLRIIQLTVIVLVDSGEICNLSNFFAILA